MASSGPSSRALQLKEDGNRAFQTGDYIGADGFYSKAIILDGTNPLLWTNRAMARLKLRHFEPVLADCDESLKLLPENMKAHYYKAQALLELDQPQDAEIEARDAYELCKKGGDKGWERSLSSVAAVVLKSKKAVWEKREYERLRERRGLLDECLHGLERQRDLEIDKSEAAEHEALGWGKEREKEIRDEWQRKTNELKRIWELGASGEDKRREVPDWAVDDITFGFMIDPVVTKTGNSYDRSSIIEHLRRSATDPLTREPLTVAELRPNLALKKACEEFLSENGWAVDW